MSNRVRKSMKKDTVDELHSARSAEAEGIYFNEYLENKTRKIFHEKFDSDEPDTITKS